MTTSRTATAPPPRRGWGAVARAVALVGLVAVALLGWGELAQAAVAPAPAEVRPDAAETDDQLGWIDAVSVVAGQAGQTVAVDLGLDNGTDLPLEVDLSVHDVDIDPVDGPQLRSSTRAIRFVEDELSLAPGDRLLLRGVAVVPDSPRVLAVRATVRDAAEPTTVDAYVLVGTAVAPDLAVTVEADDESARIRVANRATAPAVARLGVDVRRWIGATAGATARDLLVPASGERVITLDTPAGLGPVRVGATAVADSPGDDAPLATATRVVWTRRSLASAVAVALVVATVALVILARRHRRHTRPVTPGP